MSAIPSMVVLQETLALWPLALDNTVLNNLLLLIGAPLVAGLVITAVVMLTTRSHHGADDPDAQATWIGSKAQHDPILGGDNAAGQAAQQGGPAPDAPDASINAPLDDKGGASARW